VESVGHIATSVQTMAESRNPDDVPAAGVPMIAGPLDGYHLGVTDVPVRIYDLTLDGCLVEIGFGTLSGKDIRLQIDLPGESWTIVRCETLHIAGHNAFAVKFLRLDQDTRRRIARALDRLRDRPPEDGASVINGEANDD
jgi:hypothetical protein